MLMPAPTIIQRDDDGVVVGVHGRVDAEADDDDHQQQQHDDVHAARSKALSRAGMVRGLLQRNGEGGGRMRYERAKASSSPMS